MQPASRRLAPVTSARLASTSARSEASKLMEPAMMIIAGEYSGSAPRLGGAQRVELVHDQCPALHDGDQAGRILEHADVGKRVAVDDEQDRQVALTHRPELVGPAHELRAVARRPTQH